MKFTDFDLLSVLTGALLLTLALARFLETPIRPFMRATVFGSPLGLNLSAANLMVLLVLGLAVTGTAVFLQSHPAWPQADVKHSYMFWIVPGLLSVALLSWLNRLEDGVIWGGALLACAMLIPAALLIEYSAVDSARQPSSWPQWGQMALVHLTAVILFTLIYDARIRSLLSGTAVLLIAALLAARLFWVHNADLVRAFQYGGLVGLSLGQMTWVFNYAPMSGLQGGLLLLLLFYLLVGLLQQHLLGQFDDGENGRRILLEYGGITIIAFALIVMTVP